MARSRTKSIGVALVITFSVFLLIVSFNQTEISKRLEQLSYDYHLSVSRADKPLPKQVIVILIDEPSLKIMDPVVGRWPWPRSIYKNLIDYISSGQPAAILFDILFTERQLDRQVDKNNESPNNDELLIQATHTSKLTHHAMQFIPAATQEKHKHTAPNLTSEIIVQHGLSNNIINKLNHINIRTQSNISYEGYISPIKGLITASSQLGIVNAMADNDGIYRRTQLFYQYDDTLFPSLSIAPLLSNLQYQQTIIEHQNRIYQSQQPAPLAINFYGDYRAISMGAVLSSMSSMFSGDVDKVTILPDAFTNNYVFIGSSAIGLHDLKPTAISNLAPGVFVHASMLANIIDNDLLKPIPFNITLIIIFFLSIVTAISVILIRNIYVQTLIPIILCLVYFQTTALSMQNNYIVNYTLPSFAIIFSWLLTSVYLFSTEKKEKDEIRTKFSQYVSPAALSVMVDDFKDYNTLGYGSEEYVTVLFSDIRGFTNLSEKLGAKEVVTVLNYYFTKMTNVIFKHHGTIDKFIGDAIMATWGAPIKSNNHAMDAVSAAIDMHHALEEVNEWLHARNLGDIQTGIGVHTGTAILGSIGSAQKADYTVIGDTVNLSSRLEGITKLYKTPIIISANCYNELNGEIPCQILDCVQVKGKSKSVDIYAPIVLHENLVEQPEFQAVKIEQVSQAAFQAYQAKNWTKALGLLRSIPPLYQNQVLIEKCSTFLDTPPEENWNIVNVMSNK